MYLMGLFRPILSPENTLFQSSHFCEIEILDQKIQNFDSHQISVTDLKSKIWYDFGSQKFEK